MHIGILGPLEVRADGRRVPVAGPRLCALLIRLALEPGRWVPVSRLVAAVWPEQPPADEVNALQSLVSRLRRPLGPAAVQQSDAGYRLAVEVLDVDADTFLQLADTGRRQLRADGDPAAAAATLQRALGLWRGPPPAAMEAAAATRLAEQRLDAISDRIDADLQLGRHGDCVVDLETLTAAHPLREGFAGQLMTALAGSGRQAEALTVYERVRRRLADELGVDPSPELRERHLGVLRGAPASPVTATDRRTNLRSALTGFFGREEELAQIGALLDRGRLVTVLGTGGAGKTRLATEAAVRRLAGYPDGVWSIELAPLTDPAEVAHTVLGAVGVREQIFDRRTPHPPRSVLDRLLDALDNRGCLLVLDNCEHVLDAVASLVDVLLARLPRLQVLATSRESLGVGGELLAPLSPLATPPPTASLDEARGLPAVRLFADRAAAVRPDFRVDASTVDAVTELVRRLDGLPLALELAAARMRALPVGEIALRLSDRFRLLTGGSRTVLPRHRTLRAVVDWSWDLLGPGERLLAERIAVFPAGVTPGTAAGVCADSRLPAAEIPDLLIALVDKSLLQLADDDGPRYRMLETIREYGTERLAERGELARMRRAHADYFARFANDADPKLRGREQVRWLSLLNAEHDNVLAALRALCDEADVTAATALSLSLGWYWTMTDRHAEAATWLGIVLDLPGSFDPDTRTITAALHAMNTMAARDSVGLPAADSGERVRRLADELSEVDDAAWPLLAILKPVLLILAGEDKRTGELLDVAVTAADPWVRATAHAFRARYAENSGDVARTRADTDAAYEGFAAIGDTWGLALVLPLTAQLRIYAGDLAGADAALGQARAMMAQLSASDMDLFVLLQSADLRIRLGDITGARDMSAAALRSATARSGVEMTAVTLALASSIERLAGDLPAAGVLLARARAHLAGATARTAHADHGRALLAVFGVLLDVATGDLDSAAAQLTAAYPAARATGDMPINGLVATATAALAAAQDRPATAARLLGVAARLRGADDPTAPDVVRITEMARRALGAAAFDAARQEGWQLDAGSALDAADPAYLLKTSMGPA